MIPPSDAPKMRAPVGKITLRPGRELRMRLLRRLPGRCT
jgi:hypothetical protein